MKIKNVQRQEVVIGGWLPGAGRREESIGSLAVGYYDGDDLKYAGNVGTGFKEADLVSAEEAARAPPPDASPFAGRQPKKGTQFVEPKLVAEAGSSSGRAPPPCAPPRSRGCATDQGPRTVVREVPE